MEAAHEGNYVRIAIHGKDANPAAPGCKTMEIRPLPIRSNRNYPTILLVETGGLCRFADKIFVEESGWLTATPSLTTHFLHPA